MNEITQLTVADTKQSSIHTYQHLAKINNLHYRTLMQVDPLTTVQTEVPWMIIDQKSNNPKEMVNFLAQLSDQAQAERVPFILDIGSGKSTVPYEISCKENAIVVGIDPTDLPLGPYSSDLFPSQEAEVIELSLDIQTMDKLDEKGRIQFDKMYLLFPYPQSTIDIISIGLKHLKSKGSMVCIPDTILDPTIIRRIEYFFIEKLYSYTTYTAKKSRQQLIEMGLLPNTTPLLHDESYMGTKIPTIEIIKK